MSQNASYPSDTGKYNEYTEPQRTTANSVKIKIDEEICLTLNQTESISHPIRLQESALITMASEMNLSAIPSASAISVESPVALKPKRRMIPRTAPKKPEVEPAPIAPVEEENGDEKQQEQMITIPLAEYERLLAIAEKAGEKTPKPAKGRIATKDAVLRDMLRDGEKVFSSELVNTISRASGGDYILKMRATFVAETNGFVIRADDEAWNTQQMIQCSDENVNKINHSYKKRGHIASPTTLCSYFRFMMNHNGLSKQDKSTTCGFAKCFVTRDGKEIRLAHLL